MQNLQVRVWAAGCNPQELWTHYLETLEEMISSSCQLWMTCSSLACWALVPWVGAGLAEPVVEGQSPAQGTQLLFSHPFCASDCTFLPVAFLGNVAAR